MEMAFLPRFGAPQVYDYKPRKRPSKIQKKRFFEIFGRMFAKEFSTIEIGKRRKNGYANLKAEEIWRWVCENRICESEWDEAVGRLVKLS